jgi:tRNA(Ile)-lysidine synthase
VSDSLVSAACRGLAALDPPARLLIAVSGGADSVALLHALWAGRARRDIRRHAFVVGHFDHRLRADSALDRDLVREHAEHRGWPFVHTAAPSPLGRRGGLEEAAREARYAALASLAAAEGCGAVVTAHTATDQAETLLWRLARGSGARGLGAMRPRRKLSGLLVLRPLLEVTREETRAYCVRRRLAFRDDPTNEDGRPRARLRAEILPVLERLAPGAVLRLASAAQRLREDNDLLDVQAATCLDPADRRSLLSIPTPLRRRILAGWVARELGTRRGLSAVHLKALEAMVLSGRGEVELPAAAEARRVALLAGDRLVIHNRSRVPRPNRSPVRDT